MLRDCGETEHHSREDLVAAREQQETEEGAGDKADLSKSRLQLLTSSSQPYLPPHPNIHSMINPSMD
jgi:hypothetical protein